MKKHLIPALVVLLSAFALVACDDGDDGGSTDMASGGDTSTTTSMTTTSSMTTMPTGNTGQTACFIEGSPETYCQAGQYCADPVFLDCQNGCLNNDNCASDQTCDIPSGESVGACSNNTMTGGTTLEAVCTKLQACDPSVTQPMCQQIYDGVNETCRACIANANCSDENACTTECNFN